MTRSQNRLQRELEAAGLAAADNARRQRIASHFTNLITQPSTLEIMLSNMTERDFMVLANVGITMHTRTNANGQVETNALGQIRPYLGAHCDEGHFRRELPPYGEDWHCRHDETYEGVMKWCTRAPGTDHQVDFNVCDTCRERWKIKLDRLVHKSHTRRGHVQMHCRNHSKHVRKYWNSRYRRDRPCICIWLAQHEWRCRACSTQFLKDFVISAGSLRRWELWRTHCDNVGPEGGPARWVRRMGEKREKPGCPFIVSAKGTRCAREQWDTADAQPYVTYQCLNCEGYMWRVRWWWYIREYYSEDDDLPGGDQFTTTDEDSISSEAREHTNDDGYLHHQVQEQQYYESEED